MKIGSCKYDELLEIRGLVNEEDEQTITNVLEDDEVYEELDDDYMFFRFLKLYENVQKDDKSIKEVVQECYKQLLIDEQTTEKELQDYERYMTE